MASKAWESKMRTKVESHGLCRTTLKIPFLAFFLSSSSELKFVEGEREEV
jgi:hypothetical protein